MTEYNHALLVSTKTSENLSDDIIKRAGTNGVALVVNDKDGIRPLSEDLQPEHLEHISSVLPPHIDTAKANNILHKLEFKLTPSPKDSAVRRTQKTRI